VLLNLFRDQLDRYGEVATVADLWKRAIAALPPTTTLVANADDPLVADVVGSARGAVVYFGIESAEREALTAEHASDVKACPRCGGRIRYSRSFLGHLGHYCCDDCSFARPERDVSAFDVRLRGVDGSTFGLSAGGNVAQVNFPLPGMYNVYNALAAACAALTLGLGADSVAASLARATPAFGRMERLEVQGRSVYLALAKNPAGLNEVMRTIVGSGDVLYVLVMLNDNIADGRDVSWIWDADIETLSGHVAHAVFAGQRAEDMALRFKYAGVTATLGMPEWSVEHDTENAFRLALTATPPGSRLFIVPTYTAMLDIRSTLVRLGYVKQYWDE
jgi:UDP-N-acetylmuramyl tripeptide synthase